MKAAVVWTHTGPILVLTNAATFDDPDFVGALLSKGVDKFLATEVPTTLVEARYGERYQMTLNDMRQRDILRVVDEDGEQVALNFSVHEMSAPMACETTEPLYR